MVSTRPDPSMTMPVPPRTVPSVAWAAAFVLLGVAAAVLIPRLSRAEVWLVDYAPEASYLDGSTEVLLEGEPGQSQRRLLVDLRPGRHVLHYDVAAPVRFYAQVDVARGENYLAPDFFESRLPTLYRYVASGDAPAEAVREGTYVIFDAEGRRIDHTARIGLSVEASTAPGDPSTVVSVLSWSLALDGETVADATRTYTHAVDAPDDFEESVDLYEDGLHRYRANVRLVRGFAHLRIDASFIGP